MKAITSWTNEVRVSPPWRRLLPTLLSFVRVFMSSCIYNDIAFALSSLILNVLRTRDLLPSLQSNSLQYGWPTPGTRPSPRCVVQPQPRVGSGLKEGHEAINQRSAPEPQITATLFFHTSLTTPRITTQNSTNLRMDYDSRHICCGVCRIPIQSPESVLYYCACGMCSSSRRTRQSIDCVQTLSCAKSVKERERVQVVVWVTGC
jgi:hypothetical protein